MEDIPDFKLTVIVKALNWINNRSQKRYTGSNPLYFQSFKYIIKHNH